MQRAGPGPKKEREAGLLLPAPMPMTVTTCDICSGPKDRRRGRSSWLLSRMAFPRVCSWGPSSLEAFGVEVRRESERLGHFKNKNKNEQQFCGEIHLKSIPYPVPDSSGPGRSCYFTPKTTCGHCAQQMPIKSLEKIQ